MMTIEQAINKLEYELKCAEPRSIEAELYFVAAEGLRELKELKQALKIVHDATHEVDD